MAGIFLSVAVENLGVPFPTEAAYVAACALLDQGYSYPFLLLVLTAGHLTGSAVAYFLGLGMERWVRRRFARNVEFMTLTDKLERWYARYGLWAVFACRFVGYVRPWSSFVAGFARLGFTSFFLATLGGTVIFNWGLLELTRRFLSLWSFSTSARWAVMAAIVSSLLFLFAVRYYWQRHRKKLH
ncbi:SNARE associated Golgi protein-like protein [Ammonifex degensii KC4]|uniref:SNARE associated Golgi protein-like protein n=1 Tax=Ammonifex degensii (strain DSM 10501 / KC4) TaxID=429009 RepID=C9R7W6_AMMDK|nr:VTT domain-containing protein [Ammonifex degensii]ACX52395.1 SNARE associated Golgi protein-like protein [Ammonifex degensii KC4]